MTEITRTVQQLVADIDVDDDGLVRIHVTQPLTPDEARDAAAAIVVAAQTGEAYRAEQEAEPTSGPVCMRRGERAERDLHSTTGWRHAVARSLTHVAQVDEGGL
jgi:tetrahydromethanopterin S-methyltransferase subunit A